MKSNHTPSAKPCDVAYRSERAAKLLEEAQGFLALIDPGAYGEESHLLESLRDDLAMAIIHMGTVRAMSPKGGNRKAKGV